MTENPTNVHAIEAEQGPVQPTARSRSGDPRKLRMRKGLSSALVFETGHKLKKIRERASSLLAEAKGASAPGILPFRGYYERRFGQALGRLIRSMGGDFHLAVGAQQRIQLARIFEARLTNDRGDRPDTRWLPITKTKERAPSPSLADFDSNTPIVIAVTHNTMVAEKVQGSVLRDLAKSMTSAKLARAIRPALEKLPNGSGKRFSILGVVLDAPPKTTSAEPSQLEPQQRPNEMVIPRPTGGQPELRWKKRLAVLLSERARYVIPLDVWPDRNFWRVQWPDEVPRQVAPAKEAHLENAV